MKHLLSTAAALFLLSAAQAQIKVADDTYNAPTSSSTSELEKPVNLEKEFPHYVASTPDLNNDNKGSFDERNKVLNPVGERFYLCKMPDIKVVCSNPEQEMATMALPQVGYYEFVGAIFFSDELAASRKKVMQYSISADSRDDVEDYLSYIRSKDIAFVRDERKIVALERNMAAIKKELSAAEAAVQETAVDKNLKRSERIEKLEQIEKRKQELKNQLYAYNSEIIKIKERSFGFEYKSDTVPALSTELRKKELGLRNNWNPDKTILPIYIARDEAGNEYYIRNGDLKKMRYVMVAFFEQASKLSGSQCAIYMENTWDFKVKDALSGEDVAIRPNSDVDETNVIRGKIEDNLSYVDCKDVVLKDGRVIAVFQSNIGSFALPISYCGKRYFTEQPYDAVIYDYCETPGASNRIFISTRQDITAARAKYASITQVLKQERMREAEISRREHEAAMAKRRAELVAKYGEKYGPTIFERKVSIGMTQEMCREAWGYPTRKERTTTSRQVVETWYYGYTSYLVFEGGKLVMIQN